MRVAFIGCVEFSGAVLRHLITLRDVQVVGIVTRRSSPNSDFRNLADLVQPGGPPVFFAEDHDQAAMVEWLSRLTPDIICCFGWSRLLHRDLLSVAPLGSIGFHPAALPSNRGRHPLIWALALGLKETASTFFIMNEDADTGDIVSQVSLTIHPDDDAASLYRRMTKVALGQVTELFVDLVAGRLQRKPQPAGSGNSWRKRGPLDGQIDWRMQAQTIHNLVRALTRPYVGAHCLYLGREVKIWRTAVVDFPQRNIEPGKVVSVGASNEIIVKCDGGAIALIDHSFEQAPPEGSYL